MTDYIKREKKGIIFYLLSIIIYLVIFRLYGMEMEPLFYGAAMIGFLGILIFLVGFIRYKNKLNSLKRLQNMSSFAANDLTSADDRFEEYYQKIIQNLSARANELSTNYQMERQDSLDYYTTWVHQIKTPISVMQMVLKAEDTDEHRELLSELFRIENYVEMVLSYIRLGSSANDLVIRECDADEIIKNAIRKYAGQFVRSKLSLKYESADIKLLTDEKWLGFILEQLISNAIKYTYYGSIEIRCTRERIEVIDTGIGIAPEDIPRIFEKGYTGYNGHKEKKSTGLGLYLCRMAADKLQHRLLVESEVGKGSTFTIEFGQGNKVIE